MKHNEKVASLCYLEGCIKMSRWLEVTPGLLLFYDTIYLLAPWLPGNAQDLECIRLYWTAQYLKDLLCSVVVQQSYDFLELLQKMMTWSCSEDHSTKELSVHWCVQAASVHCLTDKFVCEIEPGNATTLSTGMFTDIAWCGCHENLVDNLKT